MMLPAAYAQPKEPVPATGSSATPEASILSVASRLRSSARALSLAAVASERVMKTTKANSHRHVASRWKNNRLKPLPFWVCRR